ncbi:MAG: hypothetical protein J7K22_03810, partial [Nanoarchaeota archaeon]|nr:hypothetical protein [Nanoarchaeota archaeon]
VTPREDIIKKIKRELRMDVEIRIENGVVFIYAKKKQIKKIIGKSGKRIRNLEKRVGMPIEVVSS